MATQRDQSDADGRRQSRPLRRRALVRITRVARSAAVVVIAFGGVGLPLMLAIIAYGYTIIGALNFSQSQSELDRWRLLAMGLIIPFAVAALLLMRLSRLVLPRLLERLCADGELDGPSLRP